MFTQRMTIKVLLLALLLSSSHFAFAAKTDITLDLISTLKGHPSFEPVQWTIMQNQKIFKVIKGHSTSLKLPLGQYQISVQHNDKQLKAGFYNLKASEYKKVQVPLDQSI